MAQLVRVDDVPNCLDAAVDNVDRHGRHDDAVCSEDERARLAVDLDRLVPQSLLEASLESAVLQTSRVQRVVLRYGTLYGSGTAFGIGGTYLEAIHKRRFPLVGDGGGVWSFVHIDGDGDGNGGGRGHRGRLQHRRRRAGSGHAWLPALTEAIGAKPPLRLPSWLGRLAAGEGGRGEARGASNAKAKRDVLWQQRYPSWREGFKTLANPDQ